MCNESKKLSSKPVHWFFAVVDVLTSSILLVLMASYIKVLNCPVPSKSTASKTYGVQNVPLV